MKKVILSLMLMMPFVLSAQKLGHINSTDLFQIMPELTIIRAQLDTLQSQYETQLASMNEEFQKKVADYQATEATLTDGIRQIRQQELAEMEQRIQLFYQTAQQDIQKRQQELVAPVHERMIKAIEKVGQQEGMTYVFDMATMLYVSPEAHDLTNAVKAELGIK